VSRKFGCTPKLVNVLLLRPRSKNFRARGKCGFTERVLGVKVCGHDIDVRIGAYFADFSKHGLTVPRTEPGIDHKSRLVALR
jgi:hypothetical protein